MIVTVCVLMFALSGAGASADESARLAQEGWSLWQARDHESAIEKFEQAVKLNPKNTGAWNGLGWAQFNSGHPQKAQAAFEKVIALEPNHPAALNGLGQVYLSRRDYDQAEKMLLKASPTASAAWYGLARLYLIQGKYDQAEKWAKKVVDSGQADDSARQMLQAAKDKKLDDALRAQIEPPPAVATGVQEGWKLMNQGRGAEARVAFETAVQSNPNDANAQNGLGWYLLNSGDPAGAKPHFEKAIELDKNAAGAMNGLARVLKAQGNDDGAVKIWKEMVARFPGPHAGMYGLAETYLEKGQFKDALPLWEQLAKAQPNDDVIKAQLERARQGAAK